MRRLKLALFVLILSSAFCTAEESAKRRRPIAIAPWGDRAAVALQGSGGVAVVDLDTQQIVQELPVGQRLADIAATQHGLLTVDQQANELAWLRGGAAADELTVVARIGISGGPASVAVSPDGSYCAVASLWARRLSIVELKESVGGAFSLRLIKTLVLPFAPRKQLWLPEENKLIVADAFQGGLAVINAPSAAGAELASHWTFAGHNIRGLAIDRQAGELAVVHQKLNRQTHTTRERVFWGAIVGNVMRAIPLQDLFSESKHPVDHPRNVAHWSFYPLGNPNDAAGDPADILVTEAGETVVLYSGVDQLAARRTPTKPFERRSLGRRPVGLLLHPDRRRVVTANTFDDTLSVFDLKEQEVIATISLGEAVPPTLVDQGESLFYDARLSLDGWYSCHSCHTDGHTNSLVNDNFGDDSFGAPKLILSLLGTGDTGPWAWTGSQDQLAEQVKKSITLTMRDDKHDHATKHNVAALTAYLETLAPPPSLASAREETLGASARRGEMIFKQQGCVDCHRSPQYTSSATYDVGLEDERGVREFSPPSLRGVSQRNAFFHDGRADSLEAVVNTVRHQQTSRLSKQQAKDLIEYLKSL